ncbi:MAG TPA: DUF177 domain-containing protein [Chloroflexia bacterium]|nr:DUF177 domain-containing protein [Chloroflexia bacterium]
MKNDDLNHGNTPGTPARRSRFNFNYNRPETTAPSESHPHHRERDQHTHEARSVSQPHLTGHKNLHTEKTGPLIFNVASLLRDYEGAHRDYDFEQDHLVLTEEEGAKPAEATNIEGHVRLTKVRHDILAQGQGEADVVLECVRCLNDFDYHVSFDIEEVFHPSIDIITGAPVKVETIDEESDLKLDSNHLLNLGEAIRQQILVNLPIKPICGDDCPGLLTELERINQTSTIKDSEETAEEESPADPRWAALSKLLQAEEDNNNSK